MSSIILQRKGFVKIFEFVSNSLTLWSLIPKFVPSLMLYINKML